MARHTIVELVDDMDGSMADGTVTFGFEGRWYEIDLSTEHIDRLRTALAPFVAAGRKAGGSARTRNITSARSYRTPHRSPEDLARREDNDKIREWARVNGYTVADRGRVPEAVRKAYDKRDQAEDKAMAEVQQKHDEYVAAVAEKLNLPDEQPAHPREECEDLENCEQHSEPAPVSRAKKGTTAVPTVAGVDARIMEWVRSNTARKVSATRTKPTITEYAAYYAAHPESASA